MHPDIKAASTIEALVRAGANILTESSSPRLDARVLAKRALNETDATLIVRSGENIKDSDKRKFDALITRRSAGEPVAYIVGVKEFWGLEFAVTRDVLIPRGDSESMIESVLARRDRSDSLQILDLGTGSGCLLCALLNEYPSAKGLGVDISPAAIAIAEANAKRLGVSERSEFRLSDWFDGVDGRYDLITANAPYIPEGERSDLAVDVSEYEPDLALFAGPDGTAAYEEIFKDVASYMNPGGLFLIEYSTAKQGVMLRSMLSQVLTGVKLDVYRDLAGRERGAIAQFPK